MLTSALSRAAATAWLAPYLQRFLRSQSHEQSHLLWSLRNPYRDVVIKASYDGNSRRQTKSLNMSQDPE